MEECGIYVTTVFSDHVRCWFRYIDIVLIWDGSKPVFLAFVNYLNVIFPGIVFNPEISTHNITYLDVMIKNVDKNDQKFSQNQQTGIPCTTIGACILSTFWTAHLFPSLRESYAFAPEMMKKNNNWIWCIKLFWNVGIPFSILVQPLIRATMANGRTSKTMDRSLFINRFNCESDRISHTEPEHFQSWWQPDDWF